MPRPTKWRCVGYFPEVSYFKPAGIPLRNLEEVRISVEEAEAIRLRDLEDLEQEECAQRMRVSRPTFHRVLEAARRKLADALLNGKAIRIEGGHFRMAMRRYRCAADGYVWEVPFEAMLPGVPPVCPKCQTPVEALPGFMPGPGRRGRYRRGQQGRP